jgi:NodT family efflux transporter outer membrane factor (OMF) lipoprotein
LRAVDVEHQNQGRRRVMRRFSRLLATAAAALSSCTVGPNFSPPSPGTRAAFNDATAHPSPGITEASNPDPLWWNDFHDPVLTALMQKAIAGNISLQESLLRVLSAHEDVVTAAAAGLPTVSGNASYSREQLGIKGLLESHNIDGAINSLEAPNSPINQITPGLGNQIAPEISNGLNSATAPVNLFSWGFSSSWELDLFGRVRRAVEQANATEQAQAEAANDALVMLESQVAQAYFELRTDQQLAAQQETDVKSDQLNLQLTQSRAAQGLTNDLDVQQAQTQLDTDASQEPGYEKAVEQSMNQLAVLTGQQPGDLNAMLSTPEPLPANPDVIGIGIPSDLARRRPDIREAEDELHAATANVGVAVASFYPDISLTGSIGLRNTDASYLANWSSLFYSAGPAVSLPIFEGGKLTANLRTARVEEATAALDYRNTVLNALEEVENDLIAYRTDQVTASRLAATVASSALSLHLSLSRYQYGLDTYLPVLVANRTLVSSQQQLEQANLAVANDIVSLYTALGGGWQTNIAQVTVPTNPPPLPAALDTVADP